jgi:hypothetical protein
MRTTRTTRKGTPDVLVVLAGRHDHAARHLGDGLGQQARVLSATDLSLPGWHFGTESRPGRAVIEGEVIDVDDIDAVLTRLPAVSEAELTHIAPGDRGYVATEMTAFLAAWLSALSCPVLNRPTPFCLMGPPWRHERWTLAAAALGVPVAGVHRTTGSAPADAEGGVHDEVKVTVVGRSCLPNDDPVLSAASLHLAGAAGVELLRVSFTDTVEGRAFVGADFWLELSDPEIGNAVLCLLGSRGESERTAAGAIASSSDRALSGAETLS